MPAPIRSAAHVVIAGVLLCAAALPAQDELRFDPEKGIVVVDKKKTGKKAAPKALVRFDTSGRKWAQQENMIPQMEVMYERSDSADIHVGRRKDPPTIYFMSGLEYFKNGDYDRALKNFRHADSMGRKPVYRLWMGKAYRQLGQTNEMIDIMKQIIARDPESNISDDALFEMAEHR
jgi:tetratricopeptide (TPR) repeat protein